VSAAAVSAADPEPEYMPEDVNLKEISGSVGLQVVSPALAAGPSPAAASPAAASSEPVMRAPAGAAPDPGPPRGPRPAMATGGDALQTSTLADLYMRQGLVDRAIEVYRAMLRVDPGNQRARQRLAEIESGGAPAAPASPADARRLATARLEEWLDTIRRSSTGTGKAGR
jgi:hypothetical protein